jgi:predicted YcjX-like family ATPase
MKIRTNNFILSFNDVNIIHNGINNLKYLFNVKMKFITKKMLLDVDKKAFIKFIEECLGYGIDGLNVDDFETKIIQLVSKYKNNKNIGFRLLLNKKIGNLILSNIKHTNSDYLSKSLINTRLCEIVNDLLDDDLDNLHFNQIKYIIIMINNLMEITEISTNIDTYKNSKFNILDVIYDYYLD